MRRVRSKDTLPEMVVRSLIHRMGYRYRLHSRDLPGTPDVVFRRVKKVIFVHGCFWHRHVCQRAALPSSNVDYWRSKQEKNSQRDRLNRASLLSAGWEVMVVWECEIRDKDKEGLCERLRDFLSGA